MKTLALMLPAMRMGGAEKIAINLIPKLQKYYRVVLVLNKCEGDLLSELPEDLEVLEDKLLGFFDILKDDLRHLRISYIYKDIRYYFRIKSKWKPERNYRYIIGRTPPIKNKYDIAIAYVGNVSTQLFCLADRVEADKKVAWIHGETTEIIDTQLFNEIYQKFDKIYTVSNVTRTHFVERFPQCDRITGIYYNPVDKETIILKSEDKVEFEFDLSYINIVSVGRLSKEKGFDMLPEICSILRARGMRFKWYLIGEGDSRKEIEEKKKQFSIKNELILLGNKNNPYPYIKAATLYVQPSYEEGYSTTICEAGILGKVILGTSTSGGIREQIEDGKTGFIVNPVAEEIANKIVMITNDTKFMKTVESNVRMIDFSNSREEKKLLEL